MKTLKTLFITLLSFILILTPVSASTTSIATPTTNPLPVTLPVNVTKEDVIKRMRVVGAELAIRIVIQQLLKAVDYVMDPENNRAKTINKVYCQMYGTPCVENIADAEKYAMQSTFNVDWKYPFLGCKFNLNQNIECTFNKDGDTRGITFYNEGYKTASEDQIAEQVFANARQGDKIALDHLQSIADEKAREEGQPTDKPKPTTKPEEGANPPKPKPDKNPEKAKERREYSRICKTKPKPTGDRCNDAQSELVRMQQCLTLRKAFSKKWYNDQDEGHMIEIENTERAVKRLEDFIDENCKK